MRKKFSVRAYFNDFGNHAASIIFGQVRRLADEFGRPASRPRLAKPTSASGERAICGRLGQRVRWRAISSRALPQFGVIASLRSVSKSTSARDRCRSN